MRSLANETSSKTGIVLNMQAVSMMMNNKAEFFKTTEFFKPATQPIELVYERKKVIGTPVKVMRTGRDEPDEGWYIAELSFNRDKGKIKGPLVKVRKPDKEKPDVVLEKFVSLDKLEKLNPKVKYLIFEVDRNYVLYEDKDQSFKIGRIIDINLEEESLLVMSGPEADDITAPLDRIKIEDIIDKSNDQKELEEIFLREVKKQRAALPGVDSKPSKKTRISERKNLVYYLKITDTQANKPMGYAVDISKQGFMLITGKPIESESLFQLKMFLPEEIQVGKYFDFSAMSRWCRQDQNPEYYTVGFQFADLSSEGIKIVDYLIEKYCS
ncbi:PilZ domain-containing protein [Thermodesulfobacteriota bacterium]